MKTQLFKIYSPLALVATCVALSLQAGVFSYPDFSSTAGLSLVGNAAQAGSVLRVTPSALWQSGAVWFAAKQDILAGFRTAFSFQITDSVNGGADGLAFVVQPDNAAALGGGGGLGNLFPGNSLAIEFDTWNNGAPGDDDDNHVAVHFNGDPFPHRDTTGTAGIPTLEDGLVHVAVVSYDGAIMQVYLDDMTTPLLDFPIDLGLAVALDNGAGFVGFTSATSAAAANHDVLSWEFQSVPEPGQWSLLGGLGLLGFALTRRLAR